mmetsp:Transcript_27704/g.74944  ORF Transcript_27704/g.74944 Transcript_27704/m.74944 type:complete len:299 (-) Transcript_27704:128-1024(-)
MFTASSCWPLQNAHNVIDDPFWDDVSVSRPLPPFLDHAQKHIRGGVLPLLSHGHDIQQLLFPLCIAELFSSCKGVSAGGAVGWCRKHNHQGGSMEGSSDGAYPVCSFWDVHSRAESMKVLCFQRPLQGNGLGLGFFNTKRDEHINFLLGRCTGAALWRRWGSSSAASCMCCIASCAHGSFLLRQQLHHMLVPIPASSVHWQNSIVVCLVNRCTSVQQQPHHIQVSFLAGCEQWCGSIVARLVDRCAFVQQQPHHSQVPILAGYVQRCGSSLCFHFVHCGSFVQQQAHQLKVPIEACNP